VLVAYLNAGADKNFVGVSEVANKSDVALHNISRNNNFFKSWGFLEESEKESGKYRLSKEAAEFASTYRIDPNGEHTKRLLREILSKDELITKLVERIKRDGLDRKKLLLELPGILGDLRADKVGLNAFIDMLAYAFDIKEISTHPTASIRRIKPSVKVPSRRIIQKVSEKPASAGFNLSITLAISPEVSPDKLKNYIKAVLRAYDEYNEERLAG